MTTQKYYKDIKMAHKVISQLMLYGRLTLMKKYENGNYGHYIVTNEGAPIRISEEEYNVIYQAYYQERY